MITIVVTGRYGSFGAIRKSLVYRNLASKNWSSGGNCQVYRNLASKNWSAGGNSQVYRKLA